MHELPISKTDIRCNKLTMVQELPIPKTDIRWE